MDKAAELKHSKPLKDSLWSEFEEVDNLISGVLKEIKSALKIDLVAALVERAHRLGTGVIGTGVDAGEDRDVLLGLGCDLFQGSLYPTSSTPFTTIRLAV